MVPVVGGLADGANALWYLAEGDYANAALSAFCAVPGAGDALGAGRIAYRTGSAVVGGLKGAGAAKGAQAGYAAAKGAKGAGAAKGGYRAARGSSIAGRAAGSAGSARVASGAARGLSAPRVANTSLGEGGGRSLVMEAGKRAEDYLSAKAAPLAGASSRALARADAAWRAACGRISDNAARAAEAAKRFLADETGSFGLPGRAKEGGAVRGGSDTTRVGRWMSQEEYDKMLSTGKVQMSGDNKVHVANPADINAFEKQAQNGSLYVEFDVPSNTISKGGADGWGIINGPGSLLDRLNAKKGLPRITEMPNATNIVIGGKK